MILLSFVGSDGLRLGIKLAQGVLDVKAASAALNLTNTPTTMDDLLRDSAAGRRALDQLVAAVSDGKNAPDGSLLNESALKFAPAVPHPEKIICVGLNYRRHAAETGSKLPEVPMLFSKFNNALAACGEAIPLPKGVEQFDYEAELVVVIGKTAKGVSEAQALDYVLGYACGNDLSERHLQRLTSQFLIGKTPDKFFPLGPYVVTADEAGDPQQMEVKCWVNGEQRQNSTTADMIFPVAHLISFASQYITLKAGDVISTGTPEGVILGMENKVWLKAGDEVVVEVGKLGRLVNSLVAS